ncbi:MAG: phosphatidate cytidylyltransferase [Actinomycetota bacterium]
MSDDQWRGDDERTRPGDGRRPGRFEAAMDEFDDEEFGGPLFGDESERPAGADAPDFEVTDRQPTVAPADPVATASSESHHEDDPDRPSLSFGDDDTGSLPHWTEPPTGDMPRIAPSGATEGVDEELDVWSSFTSESPVWKEGDSVDRPSGGSSVTVAHEDVEAEPAADVPDASTPAVDSADRAPADPTGELRWGDDPSGDLEPHGADGEYADASPGVITIDDQSSEPPGAARQPSRITIGTDPSGMPRRPEPSRRGGPQQRPPSAAAPVGSDSRNLPMAVFSGLLLAAAFLALTLFVGPAGSLVFVTVALGIAGIEYFGKVTEKGYRPAVAPGVAAIVAAPLAGYWLGEFALPLVIVFAFLASSLGFIGATSIESGPMPNMAITMLGVVWIGIMGAYAGMLLDWSNVADVFGSGGSWGTDTLVLIAVGVVANDVGAYFVGRAFGRTPLRAWISPGKSVEGFLGGTILTLIVMMIIGLQELSETWSDTGDLLMLGVVISVFAPLGDLTESMFKRNLDVKDFGTLVRGHGGVLDRFDGFLFTLPAVYYLFRVVAPQCAELNLPVCPF